MRTTTCLFILFILCSCASEVKNYKNSLDDFGPMVLGWNHKIITAAVEEDGLLTLKGVRTAAMAAYCDA